jgi:hypothetical protein
MDVGRNIEGKDRLLDLVLVLVLPRSNGCSL